MAPIKTSHRKKGETVAVYLRLRPLSKPCLIKIDDQKVRTIPPDGSRPQVYKFTRVFDIERQSDVFNKCARPIADKFLTGNHGLIFTYGITGSGKTYTMEGLKSDPGLIYRTIDYLFNSIGSQQTKRGLIENDGRNSYRINDQEQLYPDLARPMSAIPSVIKWQNRTRETASANVEPTANYCLYISLIELYNKQVHDLFEDLNCKDKDKKKLVIRTDERDMCFVANAVEIEVKSADEAVELYTRGIKRRKTGSTALNDESSRGHCVLNLKLVRADHDILKSSQLCLVDLAGSERAKRSGTTGGALHEAGNINNSLTALRKCIRALRDHDPDIHYRGCTLTRLFQSYFEGRGSVSMVLCVKPSAEDFNENNIAMEFGLLTQDVATDYASPPKRSKNDMRYDNFDFKFERPDPNLGDEEFIQSWIDTTKRNKAKRLAIVTTVFAQFRESLVKFVDDNSHLRRENERMQRRLEDLEIKFENTTMNQNRYHKSIEQLLGSRPTAPEMEPLQSSSPFEPSTSTTSDLIQTPAPTTANSSTEENAPQTLSSPTRGMPVVNPRHNRSLSCSSLQWIHHKPPGTLDTGTVSKPVIKNARSVKNLRSSDILRKKAGHYSLVHQDADHNGEVETSIHKGHILPTVCGGAQVIFDDIEITTQVSPKRRKRATSDAQ